MVTMNLPLVPSKDPSGVRSPSVRPGLRLATVFAALPVLLGAVLQSSPIEPVGDFLPLRGHLAAEATPADSTSVLRDARGAQARFERTRVRHLSETWRGMGGTCDERIGRMCIRHSRSDDWEPPPEDPAIADAREELLAALKEVASEIPGDDWVLGQRVRYLGEAERWDEAHRLAEVCGGATEWWCSALRGYALHGAERFEEAEAGFRDALDAMPDALREEWSDPSVVLDGDGRRFLDGGEAAGLEERRSRVWVLGNPLFLVPGNDRLTEHFARQVLARINERARNPYGMSWGSDLAEVLVRYGPAAGFERQRPPSTSAMMGPPSVLGRFQPLSRGILPPGRYLEDPAAIPFGEWVLDDRQARGRYAPPYAPRIRSLQAQEALFRRGDSLLVVLAYRIPQEEEVEVGAHEGTREGGLFLVRSDGEAAARTTGNGQPEGVLTAMAPNGEYLVSAEVRDPEENRAWRLRHGVRQENLPRDITAVSGILAIEASTPVPSSLEEALPLVLPGAEVEEGGAIGVAWEMYHLGPDPAPISFRLRIREDSPGFLSRVGRWLRLVTPERPTEVSWDEEEEGGILFRAVTLDLSDLSPGQYELELSVELPGRETARVAKPIRVRDGAEP